MSTNLDPSAGTDQSAAGNRFPEARADGVSLLQG